MIQFHESNHSKVLCEENQTDSRILIQFVKKKKCCVCVHTPLPSKYPSNQFKRTYFNLTAWNILVFQYDSIWRGGPLIRTLNHNVDCSHCHKIRDWRRFLWSFSCCCKISTVSGWDFGKLWKKYNPALSRERKLLILHFTFRRRVILNRRIPLYQSKLLCLYCIIIFFYELA